MSERMKALGERRSVIREIFEYGNRRKQEIGGENVFDFSLGNPSVPAPPAVKETLARLITEGDPAFLHGYTSAAGDAGVRQAIAAYIEKTQGVAADPRFIYLTAGAAAALAITLTALLPDDGSGEVLTLAPYFPEYKVFCEQAGGRLLPLAPKEPSFYMDIAALAAAITPRTVALLLNSPNNPSGVVLPEENIRAIAATLTAKAEEYGHPIYLIADEPYRELVYDGVSVPYLPRFYRDTIVCYSFSKSLSLPGERIGYISVNPAAQGAEEIYAAVLGAGRALGYVCAPALFQHLIPACLGETADLSVYAANRDLLYGSLSEMGYECVRPDGAFYLFVKAPGGDATAFCEKAREKELLLVPSDDFGMTGYVRIAYCVETDLIRRALPAFRALIADYKKDEETK